MHLHLTKLFSTTCWESWKENVDFGDQTRPPTIAARKLMWASKIRDEPLDEECLDYGQSKFLKTYEILDKILLKDFVLML